MSGYTDWSLDVYGDIICNGETLFTPINANSGDIALAIAAPDLLEALIYIEGLAIADDVRDLPTIAATARAAIAKARGES